MANVPDSRSTPLLLFGGAALAGGLVVAWLQLSNVRSIYRRSTMWVDQPYVRLLDPSDYRPINPPWLVRGIAAAGGDAAATSSLSPTAVAALPPPVRKAVQSLLDRVAAGQVSQLLGSGARSELFMLEEGVAYLNHGSYGALLKPAGEAQRYFQVQMESQPVRFMETEALPALRQAQHALAQLVRARPQDLVFVTNATSAVNTVLHSAELGPGDLILIADTTYPAVRSAAAREAARRGASLVEVELLGVVADQAEVLRRYEAALTAGGGRVRLAILDHIISLVPAHLPVAALCALCATHGCLSLVDGAHAVGALPLDIPAIGCDYYTSNAHKWLCTPRGVAFLWAAPARQHGLVPLVTSHGYGLGFQGEFLWGGTDDMTAVMALPAAIAAMQALEPAAARYRTTLLRSAVTLLMQAWGTTGALGLQAAEACMCAVEMPTFRGRPPSSLLAGEVHDTLRERYRIEVPVACAGGKLWCRISAQIYNELGDYQRLAEAVVQLAAEAPGEGGSVLSSRGK